MRGVDDRRRLRARLTLTFVLATLLGLAACEPQSEHAEVALTADGYSTVVSQSQIESLPASTAAVEGTDLRDADLIALGRLVELTRLRLKDSDAITNSGLARLATLATLETLWLESCDSITDTGLQHLARLPSLKTLHINSSEVTFGDPLDLRSFQDLENLSLSQWMNLSDNALEQLSSLTELRGLDLGRSRGLLDPRAPRNVVIQDGKIFAGQQLPHSLAQLVPSSELTEIGFEHVLQLKQLRTLGLSGVGFSPRALEKLAALQQLEALDLSFTRTEDGTIGSLKNVTNLRHLDLAGCTAVSDASVETLRILSQLRWLDLRRTRVSKNGAVTVRAALPNCRVQF